MTPVPLTLTLSPGRRGNPARHQRDRACPAVRQPNALPLPSGERAGVRGLTSRTGAAT